MFLVESLSKKFTNGTNSPITGSFTKFTSNGFAIYFFKLSPLCERTSSFVSVYTLLQITQPRKDKSSTPSNNN